MKYGEHLKTNIDPEFGESQYLNYSDLDELISQLAKIKPSKADESSRVVSMTAPPQTNAQGLDTSQTKVTEEDFLRLLESDMVKVEKFTLQKVTELRNKIASTESLLQTNTYLKDDVEQRSEEIANDFLRLEKYVNINLMGIHKILKKHDKNLPAFACRAHYVNRVHAQAWVRGDYSDIVVRLSNIYAALRDDHVAQENQDASQSFLRSTSKYWVKTEDVSRVKYAVLRHLPVFLQKTSTGESDSQFTNSVYVDNDQLELYHGRLDKTPGAIALRLRWYGPGDPTVVFVERKTHNDTWTGEVSVKERFMVRIIFKVVVVEGFAQSTATTKDFPISTVPTQRHRHFVTCRSMNPKSSRYSPESIPLPRRKRKCWPMVSRNKRPTNGKRWFANARKW